MIKATYAVNMPYNTVAYTYLVCNDATIQIHAGKSLEHNLRAVLWFNIKRC